MTRTAISTTGAPAAIGPYSQAIEIDGFVFLAGQAALDPVTGEVRIGHLAPKEPDTVRRLVRSALGAERAARPVALLTRVARWVCARPGRRLSCVQAD